ncbi:hypothetical protein M413DRAFT_79731 [Hebeloma cylindrosporum]|uniref:Uncharacterized protein n=1 Tax=Hebeloma cylindrosporum TaxID=76867 RepID=A0A0C3BEC8_HEBCY|nr:hypothetical protein M413DRAFT_79731 [Hebeloma cylindrosporum h7]
MAPRSFDYAQGKVVIQHGTIFYSPNCTRAVNIPPQPTHSSDPFKQPRLNTSMFKQPVWWSQDWAWLSFIPLAPSFLFTPFEPLCMMPRIEPVKVYFKYDSCAEPREETHFKMPDDDIKAWLKEEERIVKLAHVMKLRYGISATTPPKPSSFHFDRAHKSHAIAKRMLCLAREWFAIWMGYLAYLIAKTEILVPNGQIDKSSPAADWYNYLRKLPGFSEAWLDGISLSSVCTFDHKTPRAGIIFQWSEAQRQREPIHWFYDHHIPLWFIWSSKEADAISNDQSLAYLRPPEELIQEALTLLFSTPSDVPLAALILKQYFRLGDDPITNKTVEFLRLQHAPSSAAAQAASSFPYHGLLTNVEERGRLYNHYDDFFAARQKRQEEMMKVESSTDRQRRESREQNPGIMSATMYVWEKTLSSGGLGMYKRVKVNKKENEDTYSFFRSHQRVFNAFSNEWDFCEDFCFGPVDTYDSGDEYDDDDGYDNRSDDQEYRQSFVSRRSHSPPSRRSYSPASRRSYSPVSRRSYSPVSRRMHSPPSPAPMDVETIPAMLGRYFSRDPIETMSLVYGYVPHMGAIGHTTEHKHDWTATLRFLGFTNDLDQLDVPEPEKSAMMTHLSTMASTNNAGPIAEAFATVSGLFTFRNEYTPRTYRLDNHAFTKADFDVAMLACQAVLTSPQGRAALLRGGIVGRIAKEYLSKDGVLDGPSIEVTAHRVGYLAPSAQGNGIRFCDDQLTEDEIAIICGTYSLYTPFAGQVAVWSWFPLPSAWEATRSGCNWLEWTERCEEIFNNIIDDIQDGRAKPKSNAAWITFLRGQKVSRALVKHNNIYSQRFMDSVVPVGQHV